MKSLIATKDSATLRIKKVLDLAPQKRISNMLGLTIKELDDVLSIISEYLLYETALDAVGSLDPTFVTAIGVEIPELTLDIIMCIKIWSYFNEKEGNTEDNPFAFMNAFEEKPLESAKSGILAYGVSSALKFALGKVFGKALGYVGAVPASAIINAIQTITTGLLWAKHAKEKSKLTQSENRNLIGEDLVAA